MVSKALLTQFDARRYGASSRIQTGKSDALERFLWEAQTAVQGEPGTVSWFALRFGGGEYGMFNVFDDEAAREAHLRGPVGRGLIDATDTLLQGLPTLQSMDVLASKLPIGDGLDIHKAALMTFKAKLGHEEEMATFLRDAQHWANDEPGTRGWFALRVDASYFGIFDVFPGSGARFAHLTGHIPREMIKRGLRLMGSMPDVTLLDVVCASPSRLPEPILRVM